MIERYYLDLGINAGMRKSPNGEWCEWGDVDPVIAMLKGALEEIGALSANPLTETMGTERKDLIQGITKIYITAREVLQKLEENFNSE